MLSENFLNLPILGYGEEDNVKKGDWLGLHLGKKSTKNCWHPEDL